MKYGKYTLSQTEAVFNKLGGESVIDRLLRGEVEVAVKEMAKKEEPAKLVSPFTDPRIADWGVEREGAPCATPIEIARLELVVFHGKDKSEDWISGAEMLHRAADTEKFPGCQGWGEHAAEQLFARAAELPAEWATQDGPMLVFADTILTVGGGNRHVPVLYWDARRWRLGWLCLDKFFDRDYRFVRLRK